MRLIILSRGRSDRQLPTLEAFPTAELFVPVAERDAYAKAYPDTNILTQSPEYKRVAGARQQIIELVGDSKLLMLDDDLRFYRRTVEGRSYRRASEQDLLDLLHETETSLNEWAHVGVVDKFMSQKEPRGFRIGAKYAQFMGYNPKLFPNPPPRFDRVETNEDLDFGLQLTTKGLFPKVLTEWTKDSKYYAPGGCATWRTPEVELDALRKFAALWPGLVSIVPGHRKLCGYKPKIKWPKPGEFGLLGR